VRQCQLLSCLLLIQVMLELHVALDVKSVVACWMHNIVAGSI
jgi:hypothetical protein